MNKRELRVNCPTCEKQVVWKEENAYRPFCSSRCKLIDLGEWASEKRSIPGEPVIQPDAQGDEYDSGERQ